MSSTAQRRPERISRAGRRIPVGALALTAALIVVIATTMLPTGNAAAASPSGSNLALNHSIIASSVESSSYPASNAVDNKSNTRWSSQFSDPQWIYVDLGSSYNISSVSLMWEAAYARAFQIQVSSDATNWTTIYSTTTGTGGTQNITGLSGTGRYVRMYGTQRATVYGYSLWEFQVYGSAASSSIAPPTATPAASATATATPAITSTPAPVATSTPAPIATATPAPTTAPASGTNLAGGHPATASSLESSSYPAGNAVDGNTSTRWSSQFSDPQWIYVDLGSSYNISSVTLMWEAAYARAYQIQVSNDATNWTTIYSTSSGAGGTENLTGLSGTGRYVRMYGTQRATVYGYSLWEFQVYGSASTTNTITTATPTPAPAPTLTSTSPSPSGASGSWNLVFDDEFSGSTLDSTKWTTCYPWANPSTGCTNTGNNELEWYMPSGVSVSNGVLNLTATNQPSGGKPYTSGMVSSAPNRFSYQYGFIEARVKLPAGKGMWPAFWTLPSDQSWPPEVDVMEMWSDPTAIYMNDHWSSGGANYQDMTSFPGV
ncbi:MAG TPA: discoidin domain-containing protein, partial [Chloroflexota bacterium]